MNEYRLNDPVVISRSAPKKYQRFAGFPGQVIGTAGITESGVKYRVRVLNRAIVVPSKYLCHVYKPGFVHRAPCQFPHTRCTCGVTAVQA
jgi:hypothetical protein